MAFSSFSRWCCCFKLITSKYISLLGVATIIIFPFSYYLYHLFKTSSKNSLEPPAEKRKYELFLEDAGFSNTLNSFPLIFNRNGSLNLVTIKKIYYLAIVLCQEDLSLFRRKLLLLRRSFFSNLDKYLELTVLLYEEYASLLENSLRKLLKLKKIDRKLFETSVLQSENQELLRRNFLRDAAWSVFSENQGKILARERMKEYVLSQIADLRRQKQLCAGFLKTLPPNLKKIVVCCRADDLAYAKLGVEDVDYVRSLKKFVRDVEITRLIEERNRVLLEE